MRLTIKMSCKDLIYNPLQQRWDSEKERYCEGEWEWWWNGLWRDERNETTKKTPPKKCLYKIAAILSSSDIWRTYSWGVLDIQNGEGVISERIYSNNWLETGGDEERKEGRRRQGSDDALAELIQFPLPQRRSLHIKQWTTPFNCAKEPDGLSKD